MGDRFARETAPAGRVLWRPHDGAIEMHASVEQEVCGARGETRFRSRRGTRATTSWLLVSELSSLRAERVVAASAATAFLKERSPAGSVRACPLGGDAGARSRPGESSRN
jgi:hypothetical protein